MYSSEHVYKLAETRHKEILREAEANRRHAQSQSKPPHKISPRIAWALVGPAFAMVILSLIV